MDIRYIVAKLDRHEKRIAILEKRRGGKIGEMAIWIKDKVNERTWINTDRLREEGASLGYSWQMLQRCRREMLENEIESTFEEERGWIWRQRKARKLKSNLIRADKL